MNIFRGPLQSEYKNNFGERGENPMDKFPEGVSEQPKPENLMM
jgi:hypothetical protein